MFIFFLSFNNNSNNLKTPIIVTYDLLIILIIIPRDLIVDLKINQFLRNILSSKKKKKIWLKDHKRNLKYCNSFKGKKYTIRKTIYKKCIVHHKYYQLCESKYFLPHQKNLESFSKYDVALLIQGNFSWELLHCY